MSSVFMDQNQRDLNLGNAMRDELLARIAELEAKLGKAMDALRYGEEKDLPLLYAESQDALEYMATGAAMALSAHDDLEKLLEEAEAALAELVSAASRGSCDMSDGCPPNHGGLYPDATFCEGCTLGPLLVDLRNKT